MARPKIDLDKKIIQLRAILSKYGGLPSQKVDKVAYANIKYFVKTYGDDERIKNLMHEYNIEIGSNIKHSNNNYELRLVEIEKYLKAEGKIPSIKDDATNYNSIRYFFQKFADRKEVLRLKYLYVYGDIYPLDESKENAPNTNLIQYILMAGLTIQYGKVTPHMNIFISYILTTENCLVVIQNQWWNCAIH